METAHGFVRRTGERVRTKDKDQGLQVGRMDQRKQAWKRDQGCGWSILNQTRNGRLVSLSHQGVAYISGSPSGVEQGCGLDRALRETPITSAPWKHTSHTPNGGYRCALGAETWLQVSHNAQQTQPKAQTRS